MSSPSAEKFERWPGPTQITVGNRRRPSQFIINDHRLRVVLEGVTPATVGLQTGLYEIEVYSESETQNRILQAEPGSCLDASALGVPIDTDIPVVSAQNRDQFVAEAVSRASGALRDTRCESGLAIIVIGNTTGPELLADNKDTWLTLLDATYKKLHRQKAELEAGVWSWHSALDPGGYVVRFNAPGGPVEMPVWVSSGFQTILFLPLADTLLADRASVHMVPIAWIWTGFDLAAGLLELGLNSIRKGRRPFGGSLLGSNIVGLARTNPMLGLIRIHDLWHFAPESTEFRLLAGRLECLVPGHPDLVATTSDEQLYFPPMLASGLPATLGKIGGAPNRVVKGSILEASYERLIRFGPLVTWQAGEGRIPYDKQFTAGTNVVPGSSFALVADLSAGLERVRRVWNLFPGALVGYRLLRCPPEKVVEVLRRLGKSSSARRVALYLADLALVDQSRRVRLILAGLNLEDLSEATSLPHSIVEDAISEIRSSLTRTRLNGQIARITNGKEKVSPERTAWWLILALIIIAVGYALGLWLLGPEPLPAISSGGAALGIIFLIALAIERVLEPLSRWLGPSAADAVLLREQKVMISQQRPPSQQIAREAAENQGRLTRARAVKALISWAVATALAYVVCGGLKILLLSAVVHAGAARTPWHSIDLLVTGLIVGASTKPLHALVTSIQKRSRRQD